MNKIYRLVWNRKRGAWVAASEVARGQSVGLSASGATCRDAVVGTAFLPTVQSVLFVLAGLTGALPVAAWAAGSLTPISMPSVGSSIYDPNTQSNQTVIANDSILLPFVQVSNGDLIFLPNAVNSSFIGINGNTWYVNSVSPDTGPVTSVQVTDCGKAGATYAECTASTSTPVSQKIYGGTTALPPSNASSGSGYTSSTPSIPTGNTNVFYDVRQGNNGGSGGAGGGICFPDWLGGGCWQWSPTSGGAGAHGPDINAPITTGPIATISPNLKGITVASIGGNGGTGGSYIGFNGTGASGGVAGAGGNVVVTNRVDVTTSGTNAYGMIVQSMAGQGGQGGAGYIASSGGSGGSPAQAGTVSVDNYGTIETSGSGAIGILAQSLGGGGGDGGSSYGFVSQGGGGSAGGNGSTVTVKLKDSSAITTYGSGAHGVLAQSIGGSGGNSGDSGGLVAFNNSGAYGGDGGNVSITAETGSQTTTIGNGALGLFAQSIGGGGGSGGLTIGVAAMGASGGGGGSGGSVSVTVQQGAQIATGLSYGGNVYGESAHDIFAQSVGGGGGATGVSGGLVAFGASGGSGGSGGSVTVDTAGTLYAGGQDARGVFAQSVGGGGGAALGTGGLLSLGGSGASGASGGSVVVTQQSQGSIVTRGAGGDGIFAQSVGGGGGAGSASGGLVALGGSGGGGGNGGTVTVNNDGSITTEGSKLARGIFAQSVGGGGGSGGDSGGLVTFGGSGSVASNGGSVAVANTGTISTHGSYSAGIEAQSIGGGGGDGGVAGGGFSMGGSGSGGGTGGNVTVSNSGAISTVGAASADAIHAQSIGGGGGNGAASGGLVSLGGGGGGGGSAGAVSVTSDVGALSTSGSNSRGIFAQSVGGGGGNGGFSGGWFAMGGNAGNASHGGSVTVTNGSSITTLGDAAYGIFAQSVGGGGGNGGGAVSAGLNAAAAIGGTGGGGGNGGAVSVLRNNADANQANAYSVATYGDQSSAVIAQSIGGGGGNGGFAVAASAGLYASVAVGVGGTGGAGGDGGAVTAQTKGDLTTQGDNSNGILAQSIGGGGGNGGFSVAASASDGAGISVGVGGSGGSGGDANEVTVSSLSNISTQGANSYGIAAQSIGGGGGNGGFTASGAGGGIAGVAIGIGGSGASGGKASSVTLSSSGSIATGGDNATGILAQSLGGGGGSGGFSVVGSMGFYGGVSVGIGGSGGGGQRAGNVTVNADGGARMLDLGHYGDLWTLVTLGNNADGILAQSVGGGGGNGGFAGSLAIGGAAGAAGGALGVALGGSGGDGNSAGTVTVNSGNANHASNIFTAGDHANGILAQSIGGGGGNGGFAISLTGNSQGLLSAAVALGGSGGSGAVANTVEVNSTGNITTLGNLSDGILAQSVGGGGGNGGFSAAVGISQSPGGGSVAIGGSGGSGSNGGAVTVNSTGDIVTSGQQSTGIFAQSVGGGGGNGGFAGSGNLAPIGAAIGVGGSGAGGGDASTVAVTSHGNITTSGDQASDIIAQSVGGGGGNGGSTIGVSLGGVSFGVNVGGSSGDGGKAADVSVSSTGTLTTGALGGTGNNAYGILAQSIGGGGGNGGFSGDIALGGLGALGISVGGMGGGGGDAGKVTVNGASSIATVFDNSSGILAQSVGGGGGNGGFSFAVSGSGSYEGAGGSGAVSIGGMGDKGGNASDVAVTNAGTLLTRGFNSHGIEAQSIGGGGGNGGFSVTGTFTTGAAGIGVSIGGFGDGGGSAGSVTINSYGLSSAALDSPTPGVVTLETDGLQSNGILAQSIGGGGGNGGFSGAAGVALQGGGGGVTLGGFGGGGGDGQSVTVNSYNNILTKGDKSNGILAQSIGGGGGNGGFSIGLAGGSQFAGAVSIGGFGAGGGNGSEVTARNFGTIWTHGDDANGILAQSIGGGGGNGGFSIAGSISGANAGIATAVGGFAGGGGKAGTVLVESYAGATSGVKVTSAPDAGVTTLETEGDRANGILAQSIGGGGGNGGFAGGFSGTLSEGGAFTATVGGFGGMGNDAGIVEVGSSNNILTKGAMANGILAQSIGGGGGNGGAALGVSAAEKFAGAVAVGGWGGGGGDAEQVRVGSVGRILTLGDNANGLLAQSIGGGGGNGGFALTGSLSLGNAGLDASIGGAGAGGGAAKQVTVYSNQGTTLANTDATIQTRGQSANGIAAQSIGGGGGNGGFSGAFTATLDSKATVSLSIGGFGGRGSTAGAVNIVSVDNILTAKDSSNGILAQSIGGGGGDGGFSMAGSFAVTDGKSLNLAASLGGFGANGGDAGSVSIDSTGAISTAGKHANGVLAQSIGGGGGNGGLSVAANINACAGCGSVPMFSASVGGLGGAGGKADDVTVVRDGATWTVGDSSVGILAQSIGGGGGNGGLSVAGSIGGTDAKQISASVGGFAGDGSSAGQVKVDNTGNITTGSVTSRSVEMYDTDANGEFVDADDDGNADKSMHTVTVRTGQDSAGILAQSIGGGGGNGGLSISGAIGLVGENTNLNIGLAVGGLGGDGGAAARVDVLNDGIITTYGANAAGILSQSIGGGGGNGGGAITGLLGAGTNAGSAKPVNVSVAVGGFGGNGNTADSVTVEQSGGIVTYGAGSAGILAQSIGGGGGNAGNANSVSLQLGTSCTTLVVCKGTSSGVNLEFVLGGSGGTGNDAGNVLVTNSGYISTYGAAAMAIEAQSIGGGGGNGGNASIGTEGLLPEAVGYGLTAVSVGVGTTKFVKKAQVTVGGFGGVAGNGKSVEVDNSGVLYTSGEASRGILAQSIGGGGGNGGNANSGVLGLLSLGGYGGASGDGGSVTVKSRADGRVTTVGDRSDAILAQSIGGGGGNGGSAGGLIAIGGGADAQNGILSPIASYSGNSSSGTGGTVSVENHSALTTSGYQSGGLLAQSIGGGGGNGGGVGTTGITIGGFAGSGGAGGQVSVSNVGRIATSGGQSDGILAQSVGGGGGTGGNQTKAAIFTLGGYAGSGGGGGTVTLTNSAVVTTDGEDSIGLFGQSVGGGGGSGGSVLLSAVSIGGRGGVGADGGEVSLTNSGNVQTRGGGADAIRAQSVGGGGGSVGGINLPLIGDTDIDALALVVGVGGDSGASGVGGRVTVSNGSQLITEGPQANGITAQSVGGGGGNGGRGVGIVNIGGDGGAGGNGGEVSVTNTADGLIWTRGEQSNGIFAQSIGGGGGSGGAASSLTALLSGLSLQGTSVKLKLGGGSSGGSSGDGGAATVDNYGMIQTDGARSQAVLAQSIGGGGGNGGITTLASNGSQLPASITIGGDGGSGGKGGDVIVSNRSAASIWTLGADSTAIFAQSVGGGGGMGSIASDNSTSATASIVVGGSGGVAGDGGKVAVTNDGNIVISGNNSLAIMAQSVGGGGGVSGAVSGASMQVTLGGATGADGKGGDVTVTNNGTITINGNNSVGIFAQSVGGGGGLVQPGGGASALTLATGNTGNGGTVTVTNTAGQIIMNGDSNVALYSQSVGGGGGALGTSASAAAPTGAFQFSGSAGGSGQAQDTLVNQTGNLFALGVNSVAMMVQSDSGSGSGGKLTVNINNSLAFNPLTVNPNNIVAPDGVSLIAGGSGGQGAGVFLLDGVSGATSAGGDWNVINNNGIVTSVLGIDGYAVRTSGMGSNRINNNGLMIGSIDLGDAILYNAPGAILDLGNTVDLGGTNPATDYLENDGYLYPGGVGRVLTTSLTGNLIQNASGTMGMDLDFADQSSDGIVATGAANMAGKLVVNILKPGEALPGAHTVSYVSAAGGFANSGLELVTVPTAVTTYDLTANGGLDYTIDFSPAGLSRNQHSLGDAINQIQTERLSPAFTPLAAALFYQPTVKQLGAVYNSLTGEGVAAWQHSVLAFGSQLGSTINRRAAGWSGLGGLGSSALTGNARDRMLATNDVALPRSDAQKEGLPQLSVRRPEYQFWFEAFGGTGGLSGDAAIGSAAQNSRFNGMVLGIERQVTSEWLAGVVLGNSDSNYEVSDRATYGSVRGNHFSLYGTRKSERAYVLGMIGGGWYDNSESRHAAIPGISFAAQGGVPIPSVPGFSEKLRGKFDARSLSLGLEGGWHLVDGKPYQLTPFVGLQWTKIRMGSFNEKQADGTDSEIGLRFVAHDVYSMPLSLGLQVNANGVIGDQLMEGWLRAAWQHEFKRDRTVSSTFIAAPLTTFTVEGAQAPINSLSLDAGGRVWLNPRTSIYARLSGSYSAEGHYIQAGLGLNYEW